MSEGEMPESDPTREPTAEPTSKPTLTPAPQPLKIEILDKLSTLITAAFGFVAAFAWNEAFKVVFLGGLEPGDHPMVLVIYALFVSIMAVLLIIMIARTTARAKSRLQ